jgi:hypothetical protein
MKKSETWTDYESGSPAYRREYLQRRYAAAAGIRRRERELLLLVVGAVVCWALVGLGAWGVL